MDSFDVSFPKILNSASFFLTHLTYQHGMEIRETAASYLYANIVVGELNLKLYKVSWAILLRI